MPNKDNISTIIPNHINIDENFFGIMSEGVIITGADRKVQIVNRAAARMLGLDSNELIGKKWPDYLPVKYSDGEKVIIEESLIYNTIKNKVRNQSNNYRFTRKDESTFPVSITTDPVIKNDKVEKVALLFTDLTPLLEFEKAKTDFISVASHQLQGPLSGIRWYIEILLDQELKGLTDKQVQYLNEIDNMNKQMIEMVNSLLNISRIESGRIIIDPEKVNIVELVYKVIDELKLKIKNKEINLQVEIQDNIPEIALDPRLIRHVYINLLTNAIKYSPRGSKVIVKLYKENGMLVSMIKDYGIGIPKKQWHKIFEKFFRATNAVTKETDGTGLGLYLAKAVVESSRGRIWFKSEEDKGSEFYFTVPLKGVPKKEGAVALTN